MRTFHSLVFLSAGTALGLTGCYVDSISEPEPELPLASSFEVTARFSYLTPGIGSDLLDSAGLLLRLDDAPDRAVTAVLSSTAGAGDGPGRRSGSRVVLTAPVTLPVNVPPGNGIHEASVTLESLDLRTVDVDGDGSVDAVEGTGVGTLDYANLDLLETEPFAFELRGDLDDSQPDLYLAATDRLHVLDGLTLLASEPLRLPDTARLSAGGATIPLETFPAGAPYVTEFSTSAILPFATEVVVFIDPEPKDLAGHGIAFGLERIQTMEDPGMFAEDGFEGGLAAVSRGVEVVTGIGSLPALGGTQSVLVGESWGSLTMRVPVQEGDTHLRFDARLLYEENAVSCQQRRLRIGFPALDMIERIYPDWEEGAVQETGHERWTSAAPLTTVEVALPAGAGSELIFDIEPQSPGPCGTAAMLIDDVRVE